MASTESTLALLAAADMDSLDYEYTIDSAVLPSPMYNSSSVQPLSSSAFSGGVSGGSRRPKSPRLSIEALTIGEDEHTNSNNAVTATPPSRPSKSSSPNNSSRAESLGSGEGEGEGNNIFFADTDQPYSSAGLMDEQYDDHSDRSDDDRQVGKEGDGDGSYHSREQDSLHSSSGGGSDNEDNNVFYADSLLPIAAISNSPSSSSLQKRETDALLTAEHQYWASEPVDPLAETVNLQQSSSSATHHLATAVTNNGYYHSNGGGSDTNNSINSEQYAQIKEQYLSSSSRRFNGQDHLIDVDDEGDLFAGAYELP